MSLGTHQSTPTPGGGFLVKQLIHATGGMSRHTVESDTVLRQHLARRHCLVAEETTQFASRAPQTACITIVVRQHHELFITVFEIGKFREIISVMYSGDHGCTGGNTFENATEGGLE